MDVRSLACMVVLSSGCVEAEPDRIRLAASIDAPELALEETALVSSLSGSFVLELELGDLASDPTTMSDAPRFDLISKADNSLVRVLDVVSAQDFPLSVDVGESVQIAFELTDDNTLVGSEVDALCAGPVLIGAVIRDSLSGSQPNSVRSASFTPDGCR